MMFAWFAACTPDPPAADACTDVDCVNVVASEARYGPPYAAELGSTLATWQDVLLVGATAGGQPDPPSPAFVQAFALPGLDARGTWLGEASAFDLTGSSLAIDDVDGDGTPEIAIGQPAGQPEPDAVGVTVLVRGVPSRPVPLAEAADLAFRSPVSAGGSVRFGAVLGDGATYLLTSGFGTEILGTPGTVYAVDPELRGIHDQDSAARTLEGPAGFGAAVTAWDADLDGQLDLVVADASNGIDWFLGPWTASVADDRDGSWSVADRSFGLGAASDVVGDVTGDGHPDLGFSADLHEEPEYRTGRAYVVAGGGPELLSGPMDDLGLQVRGRSVGDRVGSALAGGDVDGDGQGDLLVGADATAGRPAGVLLFLGPLGAGVFDATVADAQLRGEAPQSALGRAIAAVDADGDAQADVVVGAPFFDGHRGAVYLVAGAAWLP